jgi:ATP-dependent Clp protease ATP-binding subunit ClpA
LEKIKNHFGREFCERLDSIIAFNPLNSESIDKIIERDISELSDKLKDKKVTIHVDHTVKKYLSERINGSEHSGRSLSKIIDTDIKQTIAEELLFGRLVNGGSVNLIFRKDAIEFEFNPKS